MVQAKAKNRWLIAASAVGIHLSIGSVYAWSVFAKPIVSKCGWSLGQVQFAFSLAILFLGLSAAFFGKYVERHGPRRSGLAAAVMFGLGVGGSGLAIMYQSLSLLYLFYGVLGGIGLGVGYIAPISTLVKWFPDRRGLATGLAIMGFGFAALIAGPLIQGLITGVGIASTFFILGAAYFLLMLASSLYLEPPGPDSLPASALRRKTGMGIRPGDDPWQLTAKQALRTRRFYLLWLMLYINVTCGIAVISAASPMGQELAGMTAAEAAAMVGLIGLFNGGGRLAWASFSDYIGRVNTYTAFFAIQIVVFYLMTQTNNALAFQALVFLAMTCYGGGFSCIPAYIGDIFGTRQLAVIHGYILTAWAAAGLTGPMFAAWVRQTSGGYAESLLWFNALFVVALVVSVVIRRDLKLPTAPAAAAAEPEIEPVAEAPLPAAQLTVPAELDRLADVHRFIELQGRTVGLSPEKTMRLQLAVEEAMTNICQYAYLNEVAAAKAAYAYHDTGGVTMRLDDRGDEVLVEIEDRGLAFNPLEIAAPDLESPLEERQLSNMGVHLIRQMSDRLEYERRGQTNVLGIWVKK